MGYRVISGDEASKHVRSAPALNRPKEKPFDPQQLRDSLKFFVVKDTSGDPAEVAKFFERKKSQSSFARPGHKLKRLGPKLGRQTKW